MAKRYTDTEKWESRSFSGLDPDMKLVYLYILDRCDTTGVWKGNWDLAGYFAGSKRSAEEMKGILGCVPMLEFTGSEKMVELEGGKIWVVNFLKFQNPLGLLSKKPMVVGIRKKIKEHRELPFLVDLAFGKEFYDECSVEEKAVHAKAENKDVQVADKVAKESPKEKKVTGLSYAKELLLSYHPDMSKEERDELFMAFTDYHSMRVRIKSPLTDLAIARLLKKLDGLELSRWIECLHLSTDSGWKSVFPENKGGGISRKTVKPDFMHGQFEESTNGKELEL